MPQKANGKRNKNYPKCLNCIKNNCFGGMINHCVAGGIRTKCLYNCNCSIFEEASSELTKLAEQSIREE